MAGCQDLLAGLLIHTARSAPRRAAALPRSFRRLAW